MSVVEKLASGCIAIGRGLGRLFDKELAVIVGEHDIDTVVLDPESENVAWDPSHYKHGNVFLRGYANPVKVELDEEGEADLVPSDRYESYMDQHLLSQLTQSPGVKSKLFYGLIGLLVGEGVLATLIIATLYL